MLHQSVPELFNRDPSPWNIAFRVILLMAMLIAAVWLIKDNMSVANQNTQVENMGKEVSDGRRS